VDKKGEKEGIRDPLPNPSNSAGRPPPFVPHGRGNYANVCSLSRNLLWGRVGVGVIKILRMTE